MTPEAKARQTIDALLEQAGWHVCHMADAHNRVHNLLRQLADSGRIRNVGGRRWPKWVQGGQLAGTERSKGNT